MLAIQLYDSYIDHFVTLHDTDYQLGDLLLYQDQYYMIINEADNSVYEVIDTTQTTIIYHQLISRQTLDLIHRMVYHRYSTYHKVLSLFIPSDRHLMSKYPYPKQSKPSYKPLTYHNHTLTQSDTKIKGQQLIIMPDLWTMTTMIDIDHLPTGSKVLYSAMTYQQKIVSYRNIKYGVINTLICTHSQIFQDRKSLNKILIIDPHKRYYKNTHNPKYNTLSVATYMADLYHADLQIGSVFPSSLSQSGSYGV